MRGKKPFTVITLLVIVLFQSISGFAGGAGLINDPTGESLNIPLEWLNGSPFGSYLIPGIILFTILGIYPLIVSFGLWKRRMWSWYGSLLLGVALIIWIIVEIVIIGYQSSPPLQLIYGLVGIVILSLSRFPSVKKYFLIDDE